MWGRVRLAEREDGGGGGGQKEEEIRDGASEGGDGEGFAGFMDEESDEESFRTAGAKLENLDTNGLEDVQCSTAFWDETIDDQDISAEEKVFFLFANPIRGFKY